MTDETAAVAHHDDQLAKSTMVPPALVGMGLVEFIRACLAEDERVAEAAAKGEWQASQSEYSEGRIEAWEPGGRDWSMVIYDEGGHDGDDAAHIVAWQPSRVLAEIAAKRKRADCLADLADKCPEDDWPALGGMELAPMADLARWLLRVEAEPFRDRPGFDERWTL